MDRRLLATLSSLAVLTACASPVDSQPDASSCPPSPNELTCGGDLSGTWHLASGSCATAFGATLALDGGLTMTFGTGGTYSLTGTGQFSLTIPPSFFAQNADGGMSPFKSCADFNTEATEHGGSCTTSSQDCVCTYPTSSEDMTGSYSTSGNRVTRPLSWTQGATETESYCVSGNTLSLSINIGNFGGVAVFTRQ